MPSTPSLSAPLERAFPSHPRVDRYFPAASTEAARQRLTQAVLRGEGAALLIGAPGVGKSMLLEVVATDLAAKLEVVRLGSAQLCTRRALLQAILHGLGSEYKNHEEGELRLSLSDRLSESPRPIALLIDEAQALPVRLLEELRMLTNLTVDAAPRLRLVLAGTNSLDEAFTVPELDAFNQRLAARCYLDPLRREETSQYVRAHLAAVGADPDAMIVADAYDAIALASDGLPRLINQVADRAIVLGAERGSDRLDAALIGEAWSDLHQLSAPWQSPAASPLAAAEPNASDIEFGLLDDEDQALQAEAEAVTALASEIGVDDGVWDAGDKLRELGAGSNDAAPAEPVGIDDAEDEFVSYAFPSLAENASAEADADDLVDLDLELESDLELDLEVEVEVEVELEAPADREGAPTTLSATPATRATATNDPFAECFDEEEVVLDPYADLERVIPAAIMVQSQEPSHLTEAFDALAGEASTNRFSEESLAPETPNGDGFAMAEPIEVAAAPEQVFQASASAQTEADDILIVEVDDSPAIEPGAVRQEYAELFANLRQG